MSNINLMLESVLSDDKIKSKEMVESILADKISKRFQECKENMFIFNMNENKLADVMGTVRYHIGPVSKDSVISKALKDKTAKEVAKEHGLPIQHATKFVNDYCSSC